MHPLRNSKYMYGYIYITKNIVNGTLYIGRRKLSIFDPSYLGSGKLLQRAIRKYGIHKFTVQILAKANSLRELNSLEKEYIAKYRSIGGLRSMYNISNGGDAVMEGRRHTRTTKRKISCSIRRVRPTGFIGRTHSEESKQKIRKALIGRINSIAHNRRISLGNKGRMSPMKGRKASYATRMKQSRSLTGRIFSNTHRANISRSKQRFHQSRNRFGQFKLHGTTWRI